MPLDASPERNPNIQDKLEQKDNIIQFPEQEKPEAPKSGTHAESMALLGELGYHSIADAKAGLESLKKEKESNMMTLVQRIKDRVFNNGGEFTKITDLENKIDRLARTIRAASLTASREEVSGEEMPQVGMGQEEEIRKAA